MRDNRLFTAKERPGEFFPAQLPEGATGRAFVAFFHVNKRTGKSKEIVAIRLREGSPR